MGAIADPIIDIMHRQIPLANRVALESTFWHWVRHYGPEHFERSAFSRYSAAYSASRKADKEEWLRRHAKDTARVEKKGELGRRITAVNPLQVSGRLARAFLGGSVAFTGSKTRLRGTWKSLPSYATRPNRHSGFVASGALTSVNEDERQELGRLYGEWLAWNLRNLIRMASPTRGRIVINL